MDFAYYNAARIIGGHGCVAANTHLLGALGQRALIITGARSAKESGALGDVTAALEAEKVRYAVFDGMRKNPLLSLCAQAGRAARNFAADYILAIGGGSVLDGARAASVFAVEEFSEEADIFSAEITKSLPMVTVGTTAGTGSEVDNMAVLTDDATGCKVTIKADCLFARVAFCDYGYTKTMNLRQTVSTGLDALCHCLESWLSTAANEVSAVMARRGAELIFPRLAQIASGEFDPNDDGLRRDLYHGSLWGGMTIAATGTGFPHPAGYIFTEQANLPHGVACALFEPAFLRAVWPHIAEEDRQRLLAIGGSLERIIAVIETLSENDLTISRSTCKAIGRRAAQSSNIERTPGGYSGERCKEEAEKLFLKEGQQRPIEGGWLLGQ